MNRDEIIAKMQAHSVEMTEACRRLEAVHKMYAAECFSGNGAKADVLRAEIMALTDLQLDIVAITMTLQRSLMQMLG